MMLLVHSNKIKHIVSLTSNKLYNPDTFHSANKNITIMNNTYTQIDGIISVEESGVFF